MKISWLSTVAVPALALGLAPGLALGQTATQSAQATTGSNSAANAKSDQALEEIVVTAQKREQRLGDVGMAITAVRGDDLTQHGITTVEGLTALEPSLQFSKANTGTPVFTIRGVGYFDQSLAASPTVSVYQDEVPYSYPSLTKGALLDIDHVEILKGPQGTLYGQNATGGAINFIAAKPTDHLTLGVDESYGRFNDEKLDGFIGGPLTPTLSARLAASLEEGGAWQTSDTRNETLGDKDIKIGRLLLDWHPTDNFRANLNLNGWTDNSDRQANQLEGIRFQDPQYISPVRGANAADYLPNAAYNSYYPPSVKALLANPIAPANDRSADWIAGTHPKNNERYFQGTLRLDYSISDDLGITSLSTYENYAETDQHDDSGINVLGTNGVLSGTVKTYSEELRLHGLALDGKLNWLVGLNYAADKTYEYDFFNIIGTSTDLTGGAPFSIFPFSQFNNYSAGATDDAKTRSAFGNLEYHVLDNLSVHGGIRYTRSDQNFTGCAQINDPGFRTFLGILQEELSGGAPVPPVPLGCNDIFLKNNTLGAVATSLDQNNIPWRVGVDWKVTPDDLVYLTVSKGFKAGASPTLGGASYIQFKPVVQEALLSYEAGVKTAFFNRAVQLEGTVFHYDYTNKQVLGRIIDPIGVFGAIQTLVNIPTSTEDGAELSARWHPVSGLTLNAAATYLNSKVTSTFYNFAPYITGPTDLVNFKGEAFPFTPKWSINYGARYDWDVNDKLSAFVSANGSYQTRTVGAFGAAHAAAEGPPLDIKAYGLLDLTAGVASADGQWQFEIWGKNVLNTYYWTSVFYVNDTTVRVTGMPSTYGLALHYRY